MRPLEEILADKILGLAQYVLSKIITPDITIDKVGELDVEQIERMKQKYGIEGIIIDVDQTLRREMGNIPKCNQEWIESLKGKIKIIILSNGMDKKIEQYFRERGIDYIGFALKPFKQNFEKACEKMNVSPDKVLMVGDSLVADVHGGKRMGMKTAWVRGVEENEER